MLDIMEHTDIKFTSWRYIEFRRLFNEISHGAIYLTNFFPLNKKLGKICLNDLKKNIIVFRYILSPNAF